MAEEIRCFIGFDAREAAAYYACQQSIIEHTSAHVSFYPVRGEARDGSNAFTYARFLVPYLCGFSGWAIFMDGDMLVRTDIEDLWRLRRHNVGALVVKHDYATKHPVKYLGAPNVDYPRKNWSSVVLWNCAFFPNRVLTPAYVDSAQGSFLHRFGWLADDQIGDLPREWNRLVLEEPIEEGDKLRHFTIGTPCFQEYADCDGAREWHETVARMLAPMKG